MGIRKISPFGLLISLPRHDTLHRHRVRNAIDYPILVLLVHVLSHPSSNTYAESDSAFSWRMHKNDEPRGLELAMLAIASGAAVDLARTGLQAVPQHDWAENLLPRVHPSFLLAYENSPGRHEAC